MLERLKADPALRLSETGRVLLRMLTMHSIDGQEWERILHRVPPHLYGVIAEFAREHARVWTECADRLENWVATLAAE
uniref:Transcriptional regulator n=1 Tax=uncultured bacterium esnapd26 TaxID=1366607 RepID=S5TNC4_9BACT|nr:transcriptional regulator [uncultured bacterium esnapd26]